MGNERDANMADALDHIMRVARGSRTQTRRIRWICERARCALENEDWRAMDLSHPRMVLRGLPPHLAAELEHMQRIMIPQQEVIDFHDAVKRWHEKEVALRFAPDRPAN